MAEITSLDHPDFLTNFLQKQPSAPTYRIAFSGGLDSTVLLHLCADLATRSSGWSFSAIHIHHGLQPEAEDWVRHCRATCQKWGMPLEIIRVCAQAAAGESPEAAARNARYRALRARLKPREALLTAQHLDDQAETLLLQLFRGAGLSGLSAMPMSQAFTPGVLMRPLLGQPRERLEAYAQQQSLDWVEDPSNHSLQFDRNYLRRQIMPLLKQRWPGVATTLARTASHCAEAQTQLDRQAKILLKALTGEDESCGLSVTGLRAHSRPDQRLVLRKWIRQQGYRAPATTILERILREGISAAPDRNPVITWPEAEVRRYRSHLYLLPPLTTFSSTVVIPWESGSLLTLPDANGQLELCPSMGEGIALEHHSHRPLTVRFRQGGERLKLPGRPGHHSLKKLFQEQGLPPWIRERVPLIYLGDDLAAVGEFWVADEFCTHPHAEGVMPRWNNPDWMTRLLCPSLQEIHAMTRQP